MIAQERPLDLLQHDEEPLFPRAEHEGAKRISQIMECYKLEFWPTTSSEDDPDSKGHLFFLDSQEHGEFPEYGFEVWIDDRDNDGDVAQTVVDQLFELADDYRRTAEQVAGRLDRTPSSAHVSC